MLYEVITVEADEPGVAHGWPRDAAVEHPRQPHVEAVAGTPGQLLLEIDPGQRPTLV